MGDMPFQMRHVACYVFNQFHGCCREVFDPFSGWPFHVRRLLDGLQVRQRQPYLREAQTDDCLERLATASMKRPGVTHDNRHGTVKPEQYDGYEAQDALRASHRL